MTKAFQKRYSAWAWRARAGVLAIAIAVQPISARAEASHHVGGATGQVIATTPIAGLDRLAGVARPDWDVQLFPSYLHATRSFDGDGHLTALTGATQLDGYGVNGYVERRFGPTFAVSALGGWQALSIRGTSGTTTLTSLSDTYLSARHSDVTNWDPCRSSAP